MSTAREQWFIDRDLHLANLPSITESEITDLQLARDHHLSQAKRIQKKIREARARLAKYTGRG